MVETVTPPATGEYLILGLAVTGILLGAFLLSLVMRFRGLRRDLETLDEIARDDT